jgi:hypothetical protein
VIWLLFWQPAYRQGRQKSNQKTARGHKILRKSLPSAVQDTLANKIFRRRGTKFDFKNPEQIIDRGFIKLNNLADLD